MDHLTEPKSQRQVDSNPIRRGFYRLQSDTQTLIYAIRYDANQNIVSALVRETDPIAGTTILRELTSLFLGDGALKPVKNPNPYEPAPYPISPVVGIRYLQVDDSSCIVRRVVAAGLEGFGSQSVEFAAYDPKGRWIGNGILPIDDWQSHYIAETDIDPRSGRPVVE
jgi:hypothetical protein